MIQFSAISPSPTGESIKLWQMNEIWIYVDAAHWWWLMRDPPPTHTHTHMLVKRCGCTAIHNKALYKCFIHSFTNHYDFQKIYILFQLFVSIQWKNHHCIVRKHWDFSKFLLCFTEEKKRFGTTCGWVNDYRIFMFGVYYPFNYFDYLFRHPLFL